MTDLRQAVADYLVTRRALGFKLARSERLLDDFVQSLAEAGTATITTAQAMAWATQTHGGVNWQADRLSVVRQWARYVRALDPATEVPPADLLPRSPRRAIPFIYTETDLHALIQATGQLHSRIRQVTYATLLGLLAVTGMRVGEALRLERDDVDEETGALTIHHTKFDKSRWLVLHPTTVAALHQYAQQRDRLIPHPRDSSFFVSQAGRRLRYDNVQWTFGRLARQAHLVAVSPRCRPRLHDLRHTFAVQTLLDWYREDADVAARLPILSTYLGHTAPRDTYWYLSATPDLLRQAAHRLEHQGREQP